MLLPITQKILIWDNDGTVTSSKNPNDPSPAAKVILSGVKEAMEKADFNFVISGFKSPESEAQDFDPDKIADNFISLMKNLPIQATVFSPLIGGIACYVVIKKSDSTIFIKKAHEDPRYKSYIGKFKKPEIGMFVVLKDIAFEEYGQVIDQETSLMIGDTWHDKEAAKRFGIPFLEARFVHKKTG